MNRTSTTSAFVAATAAALFLTACGSGDDDTPAAESLTVSSAWAKAADSGMTAAFAELENTGDTDLHIVSAASTVAGSTELHEMAPGDGGTMVMRETEDGFVVPARSTHALEPGGDHIMLMGLLEPITPGTDVVFTLTFDDGSTTEFSAQVRDFSGAQEEYAPGHGLPADAGEHDMPAGDHDMPADGGQPENHGG